MTNKIFIAGIILIVLVGGFLLFSKSESVTANVTNTNTENPQTQKVVLSMKDANYYPQEVYVKAGQPVSISLDSSVTGCLRSFTIKSLGVAKTLRTPSDTVTFTPTKPGTYNFACSMGMAYGKLIVE